MSSYKVVFRSDLEKQGDSCPIRWEEGCPIVFEAVQVSRNTENGEAFLQAKVRNVSDGEVSSFKASARCCFEDGSEEAFDIDPLDADIAPGATYVCSPLKLKQGDAKGATASVLAVKSSDCSWETAGDASIEIPQRKEIGLSVSALKERALQLEDAGCSEASDSAKYAMDAHGGWAVCSCGKPSVGLERCPWCGLDFSRVVPELDDESYLNAAAERRADAKRKATEQNEAKAKLRKKRVLSVMIPVASIAAVCAVLWAVFVGWPHHEAEEALSQFKQSETLYELDKYVSLDDWKERSAEWNSDFESLLDIYYDHLSDKSKKDALGMIAKKEVMDSVYSEVQSSWAVDPSVLQVSVAIDSLSLENSSDDGATVTVESRDYVSWPDKLTGKNYSTTFRHTRVAEFKFSLDEQMVDMGTLKNTNTELLY